jgi:tetratricopeptide (TPR) repeat protein
MAVTHIRKQPVKKSHYLKVSLLLIAAIAGFGWLLNGWMTKPQSTTMPLISIEPSKYDELDQIFTTAVGHMQQGEYELAVNLWHQIMLINPAIPEVKVNMGFSLFELGRFETARDFFISAMQQNDFQTNAYYGLAITSEKMGDLEGALGAMKSYIHLAQNEEDQPFIRKARSALWEWESQLESKRVEKNQQPDNPVQQE